MFGQLMRDALALTVVLEFLINDAYTFSLPVELLLVPSLTLLGMLDAFAKLDDEHRSVANCTGRTLGLLGLALAAIVVIRALSDLNSLLTVGALRTIILPPTLSIVFVPCLYSLVLASNCEQLFLRLRLGAEKSSELVRYARCRIVLSVGLSLAKAQHLLRHHAGDLMHVQTEHDVDDLLKPPT